MNNPKEPKYRNRVPDPNVTVDPFQVGLSLPAGNEPLWTEEDMAAALRAGGTQVAAALALGCRRATVVEYMRRYPALKEALAEGRQAVLQKAEANLAGAVAAGDLSISRWWLTHTPEGKAAGYGARTELSNATPVDPTQLIPERPSSWDEVRQRYPALGEIVTLPTKEAS